jgi:NADH:ubiquinone oxidoreductase subunit 6 (subunit J)
MKRRNLIVITLLAALLVADLFSDLHRHQFYHWLILFVYMVALAISGFFENKWISKQADQLKARYRATNISMWIFLLLAIISTVPNIFIAGDINEAAFWPAAIANFVLLGTTFSRRHELLRQLSEREKLDAS